jgi:hypothetical protein
MNKPEETGALRLRSRPSEAVSLSIPLDTMQTVRRVADMRDMSPEALLKFYIGQGLRQDASRLFSERILETTAEVLARHIPSDEERSAIMREIRGDAAA